MRRYVFFALLIVVLAAPAFAIRTNGSTVIVPVIGRFPGGFGSQWRTDLFIHNPYEPGQEVTMNFYVTGGSLITRTATVGKYSTLVYRDVVLNLFGLSNAAGMLEVVTLPPENSGVEVRARIFNAGSSAGEFGQSLPGIAKEWLRAQAQLSGLSGLNNNRLNVGVANPNDVAVTVTMYVADKDNNGIGGRTFPVPAHQYVPVNDVFTSLGIAPREDVTIEFSTGNPELPIYGYASEVRNDSGDAIFVFGTSPNQ